VLAAIIIDEPVRVPGENRDHFRLGTWRTPWAHMDVLGKPAIHRFAESLKQRGCESLSIVSGLSRSIADAKDSPSEPLADFATGRLTKCMQEGFETVLIACFGPYLEFDLEEMFTVHQQRGKGITRIATEQGPLDIWMLDISRLRDDQPVLPALRVAKTAIYHSQGYLNPLEGARDFRRLVLDSFNSRCRLRPEGTEIKPGLWIDDGAQIERSARVVAPAFIGAGVQISEECLVTRCSNIECASLVDFGTAVEDSSVLPNTYIGIGLDLSHSIVDGRNLLNLRHDVMLDITDPVVMRPNTTGEVNRRSRLQLERSEMALTAD
jgi:hypothetical protein